MSFFFLFFVDARTSKERDAHTHSRASQITFQCSREGTSLVNVSPSICLLDSARTRTHASLSASWDYPICSRGLDITRNLILPCLYLSSYYTDREKSRSNVSPIRQLLPLPLAFRLVEISGHSSALPFFQRSSRPTDRIPDVFAKIHPSPMKFVHSPLSSDQFCSLFHLHSLISRVSFSLVSSRVSTLVSLPRHCGRAAPRRRH